MEGKCLNYLIPMDFQMALGAIVLGSTFSLHMRLYRLWRFDFLFSTKTNITIQSIALERYDAVV